MKKAMGSALESFFRYIFDGGITEEISEILIVSPTNSAKYSGAWGIVVQVYEEVMLPLGLGLMIIWFLVGFIEKASSEQMNFEQLFLHCAKLIAALYLMTNGLKIMAELWSLGLSLINQAADLKPLTGENEELQDMIGKAWKSLTNCNWNDGKDPQYPEWYVSLFAMFQLVFPWLATVILKGFVNFILYSRMLEMLLRVAAAPVALSDFFRDGLNSAGWRYLKTFLAIGLQGLAIVVISQIYTAIIGGFISGATFIEISASYIVFSFAAGALMMKSQSLCKELLGVG